MNYFALTNEMRNLEKIQMRGKLKKQVINLVENPPMHSLDIEINFMKEIRKENFEFGEKEHRNHALNQMQRRGHYELTYGKDKLEQTF